MKQTVIGFPFEYQGNLKFPIYRIGMEGNPMIGFLSAEGLEKWYYHQQQKKLTAEKRLMSQK